jgi:hypothetical protein
MVVKRHTIIAIGDEIAATYRLEARIIALKKLLNSIGINARQIKLSLANIAKY